MVHVTTTSEIEGYDQIRRKTLKNDTINVQEIETMIVFGIVEHYRTRFNNKQLYQTINYIEAN